MRVLLCGGGTAGHINPAIAIANYLKTQNKNTEILFVGKRDGMEQALVPKAGFEIESIDVLGLRRSVMPKHIVHNFRALWLLLTAQQQSAKIIKAFKPDIVIGTGGYVCAPVIIAASKMGIKTVLHEANAFPGKAVKYVSKYTDCVMVAFEDAVDRLPKSKHTVVTGNPVRAGILNLDREKARRELNVKDRFCILSIGGSLGARTINEAMAEVMSWHHKTGEVFHIHATGQYGTELMPELLSKLKVDQKSDSLYIREYIDDMDRCMAACDLIVARGGAVTVSEIAAAGRASIIIPSPNVTENHQYFNAMTLGKNGAAIVIEEKNLDFKKLVAEIGRLKNNPDEISRMAASARLSAELGCLDRIYIEIKSILAEK